MTLRFHSAARDELIESAMYYEAARPGLGEMFRDSVQAVLDRVMEHSEIGAPSGSVRKVAVRGFPYDIVYRMVPSGIEILALAHHRRRPGYWKGRA